MIKERIIALKLNHALKILRENNLAYEIVHYLPYKKKFELADELRVVDVRGNEECLKILVTREQKSIF